ncbi:MAG TPA: sulfatase [Candidatus Lokiarchaeia archaeon]|nr:sulfatase [Candidatus Lokiarchaeia archaeon]
MNESKNIIWIFGDQHRGQALGCNGDPNVHTPAIDGLAAQGTNFTNAVAGYPLCCPFRGSLLTSIYPHRCVPGHQYQLDPGYKTIAHVLADAGYRTAYFGKWHLDGCKEELENTTMHVIPPERRGGFQIWAAYENNNKQWDTWVHGEADGQPFQYLLPGYETDELTTLLIAYLEGIRHEMDETGHAIPFFAVLSVQPPHDPYLAPEEFMDRYFDALCRPFALKLPDNVPSNPKIVEQASREIAGAYAMIENLDWNVGRIMKVLEDTNLNDDTHVFFFSDHGDMHGSHGHFRKTAPYEESIRIPFIIRPATGTIEGDYAQRVSGAPLNHVDIAPTTLGLCGFDVPTWMEGTDYSHACTGKEARSDEPGSAYLQYVIPTGHYDCIDKPWRGIVTADGWKYACFENADWLMFDLNEDPLEQVNLAHYSRYRTKKSELRTLLKQWVETTQDTFQVPVN